MTESGDSRSRNDMLRRPTVLQVFNELQFEVDGQSILSNGQIAQLLFGDESTLSENRIRG